MTEAEYRQLVMEDFDQKLSRGQLPLELVSPTRKSLKDHCVKVCTERYESRDESLLSSVFERKENRAAYVKAIQNTSADEFRSLHMFLHNRSVKTSFANICLLAWMINFEPRPYHSDLQPPDNVKAAENQTEPFAKLQETDGAASLSNLIAITDNREMKIKPVWVYTGMGLLTAGLLAIYTLTMPTGRERCMIWADDRYKPFNCLEKVDDATVYPIDHRLIENFRKITKPDTLTLYSVRRVWYMKIKGRVEFYTSHGPYPLDSTKRLLPMTDHILKKYVYHLTD